MVYKNTDYIGLMISNTSRYIIYLFISLIVWQGCSPDKSAPDISDIDINPNVVRFEKVLFASDTSNMGAEIQQILAEYPTFAEVYLYQIIGEPRTDEQVVINTRTFVTDTFIQDLYNESLARFDDFTAYEEALKESLKYFKYYFPEKTTPDIYTCITGFEVGSFTVGDPILGISLDFFLGPDYTDYPLTLFPNYIQESMQPAYLVSKSLSALITNYHGEGSGTRLLDFMIHHGIRLYIKSKLMPEAPEAIVHEFTEDQMGWLRANESQIWAYMLEEDILYSVDYRSFQKLVTPSPNVPGMPPEAPGRVGDWIGFRIVEAYMDRNPDMELRDLLTSPDPQKIMTGSRYKPRQ